MQMLCMRNRATTEGYNHSREPKNSGIDQQLTTDSARIVATPPPLSNAAVAAAVARRRRKFVSGQFDEENPFVLISSVLIVQADEGVSFLVMDRIGDYYRNLPRRADVIVTTVGARHKCQQGSGFEPPMYVDNCYCIFRIDRLPAFILCSSAASPGGGSGSPTLGS
ncbi:hypothetical protein F511_12211 [Dorcoceras hygrometricum]|uniref:Uncharacterized protein n=1 Tax=Dorcoceras hygrometricum TaxID=472368 RepID=A0A2Z7B4H0_9LAMI|nr:hypothetical protein F511_12211 [Dorcoceras hygrometricum]